MQLNGLNTIFPVFEPFFVDLPVWRVFPIETLPSITCTVNFGLVADEAPLRIGDTVQFVR